MVKAAKKRSDAILRKHAAQIRDCGIEVRYLTAIGPPRETIMDVRARAEAARGGRARSAIRPAPTAPARRAAAEEREHVREGERHQQQQQERQEEQERQEGEQRQEQRQLREGERQEWEGGPPAPQGQGQGKAGPGAEAPRKGAGVDAEEIERRAAAIKLVRARLGFVIKHIELQL
eukprot:tig00000411_g526.t1